MGSQVIFVREEDSGLHLLSTEDGRALGAGVFVHDVMVGNPVDTPWMQGDCLIVPATRCVTALRPSVLPSPRASEDMPAMPIAPHYTQRH